MAVEIGAAIGSLQLPYTLQKWLLFYVCMAVAPCLQLVMAVELNLAKLAVTSSFTVSHV